MATSKEIQSNRGVNAGCRQKSASPVTKPSYGGRPTTCRRAHPRRKIDAGIQYQLFDGSWHAGRACDIGLGGLRVRTNNGVRVGTQVQLKITPKGNEDLLPIQLPAQVRWSRRNGAGYIMGLEFMAVSGRIRRWLARLLTQQE